MYKKEYLKTVFSTAFLFVLISGVFSLIIKLSSYTVSKGDFVKNFIWFMITELPWLLALLLVVFILQKFLKAQYKGESTEGKSYTVANNPTVMMIVGILLIVYGLLGAVNAVSKTIVTLVLNMQNLSRAGGTSQLYQLIKTTLESNILVVIIYILQGFSGLFIAQKGMNDGTKEANSNLN